MSLKAENITKLYGKQKALDNVSFEINKGEIVGFLGPNGAGKSTMMKIITGFIKQTSGDVFVNGLNTKTHIKEIKRQIGYLPEHNPLYLDMYVTEYLNFIAKIYNVKNYKSKVNDIIEQTGLTQERHKKTGALSKGYRQRTGLAAALIHNPEVLILDEPTTGLDPNQIIEIRNLIIEAGKNKTVMLSTHIMSEVEAICNRVLIINKGKTVADKPVSKIGELTKAKRQTVAVEFTEKIRSEILDKLPEHISVSKTESGSYIFESDTETDIRPEIFNFAVKNNLVLTGMRQKEDSMEDIFRRLTLQ
ncbi:MAG: gliding motility-associated ABC transporter ATP-binding subunit GldA [Chlorobi bacterium]|nr:gliding motility-associated ABC transporter ATP-binding subunit GldA [Chlorobiota bacterium]